MTGPTAPQGAGREFRPDGFPTSRQTLYLLSQGRGRQRRPAGRRADRPGAARAASPPPNAPAAGSTRRWSLVLDEAANICRITDLPQLYSHLGSRGIVPLTILQSYSQAVGVWGETGTKALWGAATVKLIGAGIDDPASPRTCPGSSATTTSSPSAAAPAAAGRQQPHPAPVRAAAHPARQRDREPCPRAGAAARHRQQARAAHPAALVHRPPRRRDHRRRDRANAELENAAAQGRKTVIPAQAADVVPVVGPRERVRTEAGA